MAARRSWSCKRMPLPAESVRARCPVGRRRRAGTSTTTRACCPMAWCASPCSPPAHARCRESRCAALAPTSPCRRHRTRSISWCRTRPSPSSWCAATASVAGRARSWRRPCATPCRSSRTNTRKPWGKKSLRAAGPCRREGLVLSIQQDCSCNSACTTGIPDTFHCKSFRRQMARKLSQEDRGTGGGCMATLWPLSARGFAN